MPRKALMIGLWAAAAGTALALSAANLYLGDLNQDEGWYLYAARLVADGQVPYRDFAFTQGPFMAYAYALAAPLVDAWGVAGGRLFTAIMGLAAAGLAAWLAGRLASGPARPFVAAAAFSLIAVNVYHSYYTTVVKTYSLSSLMLAGGFLLLTVRGKRWAVPAAAGAGAAMMAAAATRVSAGIVLPVVFLLMAADGRKRWPAAAGFAAGAAAGAAALFGPFLLAAPDGFLFGLLTYHTSRDGGAPMQMLVYKAGFISRLVQAYFVAAALWAVLVLARGFGLSRVAGEPDESPAPWLPRALWAAAAALTAVHIAAPVPYEDYQVMAFPLFAVALALAVFRGAGSGPVRAWICTAVLLASIAAACSSPINQGWFIQGRDRIWWRLKDEPPLRKLQRVAAGIRGMTEPADRILTQDMYLAVEANRRVPSGLELGPFSYYPGWSDDRCQRVHVVNTPMLLALIRDAGAPVAALSGYSLSISCPAVAELPQSEQDRLWGEVLRVYRPVRDVPSFGQAATVLRILGRRDAN